MSENCVEYRLAEIDDFESVVKFVDFWLTGGGLSDGVPGSGHDFFVPRGLHEKYFKKYQVGLALVSSEIVGWAVKTDKGVLIHLLIAGTFRKSGIGGELLKRMAPKIIRSKTDQSGGDPLGFYEKHGFTKASKERFGKKKNIQIIERDDNYKVASTQFEKVDHKTKRGSFDAKNEKNGKHQRTIDILAKNLGLVNSK